MFKDAKELYRDDNWSGEDTFNFISTMPYPVRSCFGFTYWREAICGIYDHGNTQGVVLLCRMKATKKDLKTKKDFWDFAEEHLKVGFAEDLPYYDSNTLGIYLEWPKP